jgi:hypothetical protein
MTTLSPCDQRHAFRVWLRTGKLPPVRSADGLELKFNPYHDPLNGRFTFAPGGPRGLGESDVDYIGSRANVVGISGRRAGRDPAVASAASTAAPIVTFDKKPMEARLAPVPSRPAVGRGSNIRAFQDPMTLEQSFPGLSNAPGGAIVAVADNFFDLAGPAHAMTADVLQNHVQQLSAQIKALDPGWHLDELVPVDAFGNRIETIKGLTAKVNELRFQRAAVMARVQDDFKPLQVETLRFVQQRTDSAYDRGLALLRAGRLKVRLSDQEVLGNFIDREVRRDLRERFNKMGIDSARGGPVQVNRRENISSDSELSYRRPDARVNDVAFDVTLAHKTLATPQVRGFFNTDFRPTRVVIIRPRQIGAGYTYAIPRPEAKR